LVTFVRVSLGVNAHARQQIRALSYFLISDSRVKYLRKIFFAISSSISISKSLANKCPLPSQSTKGFALGAIEEYKLKIKVFENKLKCKNCPFLSSLLGRNYKWCA
jgi:hypothetical protein